MTYSTQRKLRKQMYMARNTVCTHDNEQNNLEICKRLVNLRRELAQLLGFEPMPTMFFAIVWQAIQNMYINFSMT